MRKHIKKKPFLPLLLSILLLGSLSGCGSAAKAETAAVRIGCMKGPTAIGMVQLLSASDAGSSLHQYDATIAGTADEISTGLLNGTLDIAAVPCNLASVLYHKTNGEIVTAAINTLGVLYIVENGDTIHSISDLAGKTLYATGQGTTPEYTLRYLLNRAGLDPDTDVTILYRSEAAEVSALLQQNPDAVAMLPQPYVTSVITSNPDWRIALDLTDAWESVCDDSSIVTGVLVAQKTFIEENPQVFADFLTEYQASADYANEHVAETAQLLEEYDIFKASVAEKAIPYCNVTCITGTEMQDKICAYLQVLYDQNPASVGGSLPEEGMFYLENAN